MHDELLQYLRAPRSAYVRGRQGYRNGVYRRSLTTTWNTIPDLEIPRSRDGGFRPSVVPRYQRRMATLAELLGDTVRVSTVSAITRTLDHAVAAGDRRPLRGFSPAEGRMNIRTRSMR